MHLVYIDDSRDEACCVFSALAISDDSWNAAFSLVKEFRRRLKESDSVFIHAEFHAWKLVSGRGRLSPEDKPVGKFRRCEIFREALGLTASLPGARLFNAAFPYQRGVLKKEITTRAFERLLNRINRTMEAWGSYAVLICDEGSEEEYTRLARRLHVYNPIPSQFGEWRDGSGFTKNIPIERILEDPFFKDSRRSYLVQLADLCAYALLRREHVIEAKKKYGIHGAFNLLSPILTPEASRKDPEGIIRP